MPYTVKSGDNLSKIARRHRVDLARLLDANPRLKPDPDCIRIGEVLNIPGDAATELPPPPRPQPRITAKPHAGTSRVLGELSMQYETGGRGCATVSSGVGDPGGASYGSYQMTSKPAGGTVARFVADRRFPFGATFAGLKPGTAEFTAAWKALAASKPQAFQAAQHDYIKRTHFDVLVKKLADQDGIDVLTCSGALQDVIWSTAVQHGGATKVTRCALAHVDVEPGEPGFDEAFITAIYRERGRKRADGVLVYFPRVSPQVGDGVAKRFRNELKDALAMLAKEVG